MVHQRVLALFFPTLVDTIGITGAFFMFAGIGAVMLLFVVTQVPETRGISLERLEEDITSGRAYDFPKNPLARRA